MPESERGRERFIPVTRFALLDRLTAPGTWPGSQAQDARRFFRYLDHWRRQQYNAELHELEETYEPFSPDSDLLMTRTFSPEERQVMQQRVLEGMMRILEQANYVRIDHNDVEPISDARIGLRARSVRRPRCLRGGAPLLPRGLQQARPTAALA